MHEEICYCDATELARRIRSKEVSPVEVVRAHLARIDAINPKLNAIVTPIDGAERQAKAAEAAVMRGDSLGPLHGVPFTIKDCFDTAGVRTTRGSNFFKDRKPEEDATLVQRLKAAGGIPLGKTNLPEFALWWETGNLVFGQTKNPWNLDRTTGGSSGGEAAAIAAGLSPLGLGSDVGGSIRMPAHYCGIVGLKATHGRFPLTGHWPEVLLRFMHTGPMARTVRDAALASGILAGPDGRDGYAVAAPVPELSGAESSVRSLRVGWMAEEGFGPIHAEVASVVKRAAETLRSAGCKVDPVVVRGLAERDCNVLSATLFGAEASVYFDKLIRGQTEKLHPVLRNRLTSVSVSLADYVKAQLEVDQLRNDLAEYFSHYDVLLTPATIVAAHPHNATELKVAGNTLPPRQVVRTTVPFSMTGYPAMSVPFGWSSEKLPIGVQLVGRHFDERSIFLAATALEAAHDGVRTHPPV